MKKEISELKDKLDDTEEDRRKARESHRLVQRKLSELRKEIRDGTAVTETHEIEVPRAVAPVSGLPGTLMDDFPPLAQVPVPSVVETAMKESGSSGTPENKKENDEDEAAMKSISTQIRDLVRKRAELKKQTKEDSGKDSDCKSKGSTPRAEKSLCRNAPREPNRGLPPTFKWLLQGLSLSNGKNDVTGSDRTLENNRDNEEEWTEARKKQRRNNRKDRGGQDGTPASKNKLLGPTIASPKPRYASLLRRPRS